MYYWTKGIWYLWMHIYSDMTGAVLRSASVGNVFITGSWGSINRTPPPQVAGDHELTLGMQLQSHNQHQCWTWSCSWQIEMYCLFAESRSYGTFGLSRRSVAQAKSCSLLMFTALNTKYLLLGVMLQKKTIKHIWTECDGKFENFPRSNQVFPPVSPEYLRSFNIFS